LAIRPLSWKAFALAVAATAAALVLRLGLGYLDPQIPPYGTFFASILITAILAGVGAGLFAAALGLAAAFSVIGSIRLEPFDGASIALYVITALIIIWVAEQYRIILRRLQQREAATDQQLALIAAENNVLEHVVGGSSLAETLTQLTRVAEEYSRGEMLASVLLMDEDGRHLRHGAAPSLPGAYNEAIDGVEIGPSVGSCGTAAFRKKPVYVTDIQSDPLWSDYRDLAARHGLAACWSIPILASNGTVLGTFALYHRRPRAPSPAEEDIVELLARIGAIAIETDRRQKQRQLLVDELAHRVRNILAVVLSIATSTIRPKTDQDSFKAFEDRLMALSRAQRLITDVSWSSVSLSDLINQVAVTPFSADAERFVIAGPPTNFPPRLVLPFALSLHELCTNAAKYGALSCEGGRVEIRWGVQGGHNGDRKFFLRWSEIGGPPVTAPARHGFGSRVVKSVFTSDFGGSANVDYRTEGLVFEVNLPAEHISADPQRRLPH
jgi:two-component sensor histidine kinase